MPTAGSFGDDIFHIYTHFFEVDPATETPLPDFTFHLLNNATALPEVPHLVTSGSNTPSTVGLGPTSTLLQALWNAGSISSRSFGLYMGTGYDRAGGDINGSLALGGYDAGRFNGTVYNYTINSTSSTPLSVHVGDLILNDPDNGIENLSLIRGTGFDASITTEQYPLTLPADVTQAFAKALNAVPANNSDNSLSTQKPFTGNLTIGLSGGLLMTFPAEWVSNISNLSPIDATPLSNDNASASSSGPYLLGSSFLSQVYLMMNYDDDSFHLAQAVPEAEFVITKTMCPHVVPQPYIHIPSSAFVKHGLAGVLVGGIIGGSAIAIFTFYLCRSWQRNRTGKKVHFFNGTKGGVKVVEFESDEENIIPSNDNAKRKAKERAWGGGEHELPFWKKKKAGASQVDMMGQQEE